MGKPAVEYSSPALKGRPLVWVVTAVLVGFATLYLVTRSPILIGDARAFVNVARAGDPAQIHYGEPGHFLQVPLTRAVWLGLGRLGLPVSLEGVSVGISLLGTLAAIVFVGLIAAEVLHLKAAAWIAAVLFGTSLCLSTQWNGELYGLALGFGTAGLFFTLRRGLVLPAILWALSVLSHSEFALAAPAFAVAAWIAQPQALRPGEKLRRVSALLVLAGLACLAMLLAGSWLLGKWFDAASLTEWLRRSLVARRPDVAAHPEVVRALKGLITAFTVGGQFWRDILTGRGPSTGAFLLASSIGLLVLAFTGVLVAASLWQRRLAILALAWLLPFHVAVNWWFEPTVEKYHAGALPGFVLLVTGGLVTIAAQLHPRSRNVLCAVYVAACAGLNVFGAVLPMQHFGKDILSAGVAIRQLADDRGGRAVFIACDDSKAIVRADVPYLRVRSIWKGSVPEIQQTISSWVDARLREGKEPYLVGRWCLPEEWKTTWSKVPFDLFFLQRSFGMVPTGLTGIPISEGVPTNQFTWVRGDVVRLEPR